MNREHWMELLNSISLLFAGAAIALQVVMLTSCGSDKQSEFDKWYEAVINEPYDPLNGSKY